MKRLIAILTIIFTLCFSALAFANYPTNLNGNRNYILANANQGYGYYVVRNSLNVEKYAPPQYIINIKVAIVKDADRGGTDIYNINNYRFFYNTDRREMYLDSNGNSNWKYLPPRGSNAESFSVPIGEMAFALAYNMKFYGSKTTLSNNFYQSIYR